MVYPHNQGYVTPYEPGRPICIRVFLNDDDTQFAVETVDIWGTNPPFQASTIERQVSTRPCLECGHEAVDTKSVSTKWLLFLTEPILGGGVVGYYRRADEPDDIDPYHTDPRKDDLDE